MGGEGRKSPEQTGGGSALPLTLGTVLDGIPESITLGLTLLGGQGVSVATLAAVFLSNLPESMAATTGFPAYSPITRNEWCSGLFTRVNG